MKQIPILYSDDEIFIINKPFGLAVQGGANIKESVDSILPKQVNQKIYLVHRLDKNTTGLLVVAKTPASAAKYTKLISTNEVKKEYLALCFGKMKNQIGTIETPIEVKGIIKKAKTNFKVIKSKDYIFDLTNQGVTTDILKTPITLTLISLKLDTGRMHQIRIHLAKEGCPIVGDDKHGDFKKNKLIKKILKIKDLQLAAVKLSIPINNKKTVFEIENPLFDI